MKDLIRTKQYGPSANWSYIHEKAGFDRDRLIGVYIGLYGGGRSYVENAVDEFLRLNFFKTVHSKLSKE